MHLRLAVAVLIAFAGLADLASAQVVAGTPPGPTLEVADTTEEGFDRMDVKVGAADPGEAFGRLVDTERGAPPLWPDGAIIAEAEQSVADGEHVTFGGVVNAAAATVELGFGAGRFARVPTFAGEAYTGRHAGQVRFFMGEITLSEPGTDDDPMSIRMFDATGAVIGVATAPEISHDRRVLRRRAGGAPVRVTATLRSELQALPLAPEHRLQTLCLNVRIAVDDSSIACQDEQPLALGGMRGCGRVPTVLAGFAPAGTDRVEVRLGSGRALSLATRPVPFGRPGRMVTAVLPRGEALSEAVAVDAAGRELERAALRVAPPNRRCRVDGHYDDFRYYDDTPGRSGLPPGTEVAAALEGGPRLLVRDSGELLCVDFDALDLDGRDCSPPPFAANSTPSLYADPVRGVVAGIFPAQVAAIELRFLDGGGLRVPALAGAAYTGRYRDTVRFVLASTPPGKAVLGATLLDAAGREIGRSDGDGPVADPSLVAHSIALRSGAVRLVTGTSITALDPRRVPCFAIEIGRDRDDCVDQEALGGSHLVRVRVRCDRRQTVIFGSAMRGVSRVEVLLAGGRRVRARLAPLGRGQRAYLAVFGSRTAVTGVRFVGGPRLEFPDTFVLPAREPARQCGYELDGEVY